MARATGVLLALIGAASARVYKGIEVIRPHPVNLVDPPPGAFVAGISVEIFATPAVPLPEGQDAWTLCARASEYANTSCVQCQRECSIDVQTASVGNVTASLWAFSHVADADTLVSALKDSPMISFPLRFVPATPREVLLLRGVQPHIPHEPSSASDSWWSRSTLESLTGYVSKLKEPSVKWDSSSGSGVTTPLAPDFPPLSLARQETFLGPQLHQRFPEGARVLVAIVGGEAGAEHVNRTLHTMWTGLKDLTGLDIVLFSYDSTRWECVASPDCNIRSHSWFQDTTVISRPDHMKWWFIKRFLTPALAASGGYSWILVLDEDVELDPESFSPLRFLASLSRSNALIGQPSHTNDSTTTFEYMYQSVARGVAAAEGDRWSGRNTLNGIPSTLASDSAQPEVLWTTMVECGPFTAFRADVWPCVWDLLSPDGSSGFGYDLLWGPRCAAVKFHDQDDGSAGPVVRAAVALNSAIRHVNLKTASRRASFFSRSVAEALTLFERLRHEANADLVSASTPEDALAALAQAVSREDASRFFPSEPQVLGVGRSEREAS
jgi:hypothetical protein